MHEVESMKYQMRTSAYDIADAAGYDILALSDSELRAFAAGITCGIKGACDVVADLFEMRNGRG